MEKFPLASYGTKEKPGLWPVLGVDRALASPLYRQKLPPSHHPTQPGCRGSPRPDSGDTATTCYDPLARMPR